jgi:hypothetical protein
VPEPVHSGFVVVPGRALSRLIDLAPKGTVGDLGDLRQVAEGYLVEAVRLGEFLEEFHDDEVLIELSEGSYAAAVEALRSKGYPVQWSDWPTSG